MDPVKQEELASRLTLTDDQAKPLAGSNGLYTRLALITYKPERGGDRIFVLFAESTKLFNFIHDELSTPDWIREGLEHKWVYIEEVLHRPSSGEDISGYLNAIPQKENDLWIAVFNFVVKLGIAEQFAGKLKSGTYGLPAEDLKRWPTLPELLEEAKKKGRL